MSEKVSSSATKIKSNEYQFKSWEICLQEDNFIND
jgi:hypothetical protein